MTDPIQDAINKGLISIKQAKNKELKAQQELEQIMALVMEMYRLQGKIVYEPLDPEWNRFLKGKG